MSGHRHGGGGHGHGGDRRAAALEAAGGAVAQPRVAQADPARAQRLRDLLCGGGARSHQKPLFTTFFVEETVL